MRVVLFASSDFALPLLQDLHNSSLHELVAVYTQPPSVSGRGLRLKYGSVGKKAQELSVNLFCPEKINEPKQLRDFADLTADIAIVAAYGQILSTELLSVPRFGFLNLHPSLLPRWRGAAPIERAIMAGDNITGVCTIQMVEKLDSGPILAQETVKIDSKATAQTLSVLLSQVGASQILSTLDKICKLPAIPQSDLGVTYAHKIGKKETRIDWELPAEVLDRLIRGISPSPGAWCILNGVRVKILESRVFDSQGFPGSLIKINGESKSLRVACGKGAILISCIQREGKKPVSGEEFLQGFRGDINFS